ncbi:MAG: alpha/beta hydrolase [Ketobacteraceae bacterium]|nr:alpha/beta hydrolase [Ketobacteraceae bacterium]
MLYLIVLILVTGIAVHNYRHFILHRHNDPLDRLPFEGRVYRLGDNLVAHRNGPAHANRTVVCMPGFMETIAYFVELYQDEEVDLILVNNCCYQSPVEDDTAIHPDWYVSNPYEPGTVQYDAFVMVQVIQHLPRTDNIVLHGHSRGAAVMLEAGRLLQRMPRQRRIYTALLEAPVLPRGKARGHDAPLLVRIAVRYFMPLAFYRYRRNATRYLKFGGYCQPHTDIKQHIISQYFRNPQQYHITITNLRGMDQWVDETDVDIYRYLDQVVVMVPEKDIVLDRNSMYRNAIGHANVRVLEVDRADHFISLERPEYVRSLVRRLHQGCEPGSVPVQLVSGHLA